MQPPSDPTSTMRIPSLSILAEDGDKCQAAFGDPRSWERADFAPTLWIRTKQPAGVF